MMLDGTLPLAKIGGFLLCDHNSRCTTLAARLQQLPGSTLAAAPLGWRAWLGSASLLPPIELLPHPRPRA